MDYSNTKTTTAYLRWRNLLEWVQKKLWKHHQKENWVWKGVAQNIIVKCWEAQTDVKLKSTSIVLKQKYTNQRWNRKSRKADWY